MLIMGINITQMTFNVLCDSMMKKMSRLLQINVGSEVLKLSNLSRKHERYIAKLKSKVTRYIERSRKGTLMKGGKTRDRETTKE
jgi:hypothetical protein